MILAPREKKKKKKRNDRNNLNYVRVLIEKIPLGISYPPPSPPRGALRRAFAIPQSRNPPLVKTRHISTSVTQTVQPAMNLDADAIEERRRRLEPSHRMPSTSSIAEEKVLFKIMI